MRPATAVSGRTSSSRVRCREMGAVVAVEVVEEEEEVEGFRRRGEVSEGGCSERDGGVRVSGAVMLGSGDVVVLGVLGVGQGFCRWDDRTMDDVKEIETASVAPDQTDTASRAPTRHVSSTLGAFVRVLAGITVSAAAVGQTAVAPQHIISRVLGVG